MCFRCKLIWSISFALICEVVAADRTYMVTGAEVPWCPVVLGSVLLTLTCCHSLKSGGRVKGVGVVGE